MTRFNPDSCSRRSPPFVGNESLRSETKVGGVGGKTFTKTSSWSERIMTQYLAAVTSPSTSASMVEPMVISFD